MKHLFVSYETAKQLKEKGFDEECLGYWPSKVSIEPDLWENNTGNLIGNSNFECAWLTAPLYAQVIDWLRENHGIDIFNQPIWDNTVNPPRTRYIPAITKGDPDDYVDPFDADNMTDNYYQALNAAIEQSLKLI